MHQLYHLFPPQPGGLETLGDLITICSLRDRQLTNSYTGWTSRLAARFTLQETGGRSSNVISKFFNLMLVIFKMANSSIAEIEIFLKKQTFQMWKKYSKVSLNIHYNMFLSCVTQYFLLCMTKSNLTKKKEKVKCLWICLPGGGGGVEVVEINDKCIISTE